MNLPVWPGYRLVTDAHLIRVGPPKLAIHSNITPGKLGPESEHILMLDYDGWEKDAIKSRLAICGVSQYFLYRTEHGFHAIDCSRYSWDKMRVLQIDCKDHDLHTRKTAQYGRAALALHPPNDAEQTYKKFFPTEVSVPHHGFYRRWLFVSPGNLEIARRYLEPGDIAFRFYNKFEVL